MKRMVAGCLAMFSLLFTACQAESEPELQPQNTVTEQSIQLESDGYALHAVYTDAGSGPVVLLIAGSGPCDADETVGVLKPFADIASALAEQGISSLRVEKRTFRYADDFAPTDGVEEEYLTDCRAALSWLREQPDTESVYLLGHSLGGQIAAVLAAEDADIQGMILWNSTARHLADLACDQFIAADPDHQSDYENYAAAAKAATSDNAKGYYYYSATDYYWASYNRLSVIESIHQAAIPTLIINSSYDNQLFDADIQLWQNADNVTFKLYDDQSHFGYRIDTNDQTTLYQKQEFPQELITDFASFCR